MKTTTTLGLLRFLALSAYLLAALFPIYWMIKISLTPDNLLFSESISLWPSATSFGNYFFVLSNSGFLTYLRNSVLVSSASAVLATTLAIGAGYSLARFRFKPRTAVQTGLLLTQLFPFVLVLAPLYRLLAPLGLTDSLWGLIVVYAAFNTPFAALLMQSFFESIPRDLEEAGLIDGCTRFGALWRIVLPLALPGVGVTLIFGFTAAWSELLFATMLISSETQKTFAVGLLTFVTKFDVDWGQMTAAAVLALIPVCVFFGLVQRSLVSGLTAGAIKG